MDPVFLLPESVVHANGESEALKIVTPRPRALLITLGITKIVEQEALLVSIHDSPNGADWSVPPLVAYSQKFYTGVSAVYIDLMRHPEAAYLRAQWKVSRWGRGEKTPSFGFYVFAEPAG